MNARIDDFTFPNCVHKVLQLSLCLMELGLLIEVDPPPDRSDETPVLTAAGGGAISRPQCLFSPGLRTARCQGSLLPSVETCS